MWMILNRLEYLDLLESADLDAVVSPKQLTANIITGYVRGVGQSREGSVQTLYTINNGKAEALSFIVPETGDFLNTPIMKLKLKKAVLIATIVRNQQVIIPSGQDMLMRHQGIQIPTAPRHMQQYPNQQYQAQQQYPNQQYNQGQNPGNYQ